ncbi:hypothetical protein [Palleronia aestuarii]|uniref:hypothetical protein n=1 Tax=Palleronia aestuarii TaxID=568105 RepID=UPI000DABD130|nr:hypothetical protein [Palleronia aestuarii]
MSRTLIIAGSHRSGTSLTAQYLRECGLFVGDTLLAGNSSNPHGHFEDQEVIDIHNAIFAANGTDWMLDRRIVPVVPDEIRGRMRDFVGRRQAAHAVWGFKDPRICHFLPLWRLFLPDAKILVIYRNAVECVRSMNRRHAEDHARAPQGRISPFHSVPDLALRIWTVSNLQLADFAERHRDDVMVVDHASLSRGVPLAGRLNARWGLGLEERSTSEVYDKSLSASAARTLRVADPENGRAASRIWSRLAALQDSPSGGSDLSDDPSTRFRHEADAGKLLMENELLAFENAYYRKKAKEVDALSRRLGDLEAALERERAQSETSLRTYEAIANSTIWRLTGPLRGAMNRYRSLKARPGSQ